MPISTMDATDRIVLSFIQILIEMWLNSLLSCCLVRQNMHSPNDLVILKPFHGFRLHQVVKIL